MLRVGQKVRIKPDGWARFVQETGSKSANPGVQVITVMPAHPPFDAHVRVSFPIFWFREDEVEGVNG